nr:hypothetical protein [Couchioplanes caeruleus]
MTAKLVDDITDTHSNKTRESWGQGVASPRYQAIWRHRSVSSRGRSRKGTSEIDCRSGQLTVAEADRLATSQGSCPEVRVAFER